MYNFFVVQNVYNPSKTFIRCLSSDFELGRVFLHIWYVGPDDIKLLYQKFKTYGSFSCGSYPQFVHLFTPSLTYVVILTSETSVFLYTKLESTQ